MKQPVDETAGAPEKFLKLKEVQALLGVSRATVWRWTAEQGLKVVRVGEIVRIRESDLNAFLQRHDEVKGGQRNAFAGVIQNWG